ncbi:hypothetical protein GCM10027398_23560 [Azotobacter salinestris]
MPLLDSGMHLPVQRIDNPLVQAFRCAVAGVSRERARRVDNGAASSADANGGQSLRELPPYRIAPQIAASLSAMSGYCSTSLIRTAAWAFGLALSCSHVHRVTISLAVTFALT